MKTAVELQARGEELRAAGRPVPHIHPDEVRFYVLFQLPHVVR